MTSSCTTQYQHCNLLLCISFMVHMCALIEFDEWKDVAMCLDVAQEQSSQIYLIFSFDFHARSSFQNHLVSDTNMCVS